MRDIEPYVLHAALRADQDEAEQVYHLRPRLEVELPDEVVAELDRCARVLGCDFEVMVNAILAAHLDRHER